MFDFIVCNSGFIIGVGVLISLFDGVEFDELFVVFKFCEFNEFIWLRPEGSETWTNRFESYKSGKGESDSANGMTRVEFESPLREAAYERIKGTFPADGKRAHAGYRPSRRLGGRSGRPAPCRPEDRGAARRHEWPAPQCQRR